MPSRSRSLRSLAGSGACLALVVGLLACGGPGGRPTPEVTGAATPRPTEVPPPPPDATARPVLRTLASGRSYWMYVPGCTASPSCTAWRQYPRKLVIFLHGLGQPEDQANALHNMRSVAASTGGDVLPVFGVTAGPGRSWDAGFCCAFEQIDELGYLRAVVDDVARHTAIDRARVGLAGTSNGGLLATRAICESPGEFAAAAVFAASWRGPCDAGPVTLRHWHGDADTVVPVQGGTYRLGARLVRFPPADWLASRVAPGSRFDLVVLPGAGHTAMPAREMWTWLDANL